MRFSIVDKKAQKIIGTIEMFKREAKDFYDGYGLLRLDATRKNQSEVSSLILSSHIDKIVRHNGIPICCIAICVAGNGSRVCYSVTIS